MNSNKTTSLYVMAAMCFLTNGDIYSSAPLLISMAQDLNITTATAALSVTAYMGAFGLCNLIFGPLGDKFGRNRILIISAFGTSICSCLCLFADTLPKLLFLRALNGGFGAGILPISVAITGESFGKSASNAIAKLMGILILGGALATLIGGGLSYFFSWKMVYFSYGAGELIISILMLFILDKGVSKSNNLNFLEMYKRVLKNKEVLCFLLLVSMTGFSIFGSFAFTGELLRISTDLNLLEIGGVLSFFGIGGIASSYLLKKLLQIKLRYILITSGITGSVSIFILSDSNSVLMSGILFFIWGVSFMTLHSNYINEAQSIIPELRGTIMAFISFSVLTGGTIGSVVFKKVAETDSISSIFKYSSIVFLAIGIFATILLESRKLKKENINDINPVTETL